jgi:ABC-type lipoprotein release transport system permease subunit
MGLLIKISFRNLLRQRRRNTFLGIAIAIGMMILVATSSFSKGLTDSILNKWLVYAYGHVMVTGYEQGSRTRQAVRDSRRVEDIIKSIKGVHAVNDYLSAFTRVVGNGKSTMLALVGMPVNEGLEFFRNTVDKGNFNNFTNTSIENPVVMADDKAKDLDLKIGDQVNVRLSTINGQVQSARLTLVATQKTMTSMMAFAFYIRLDLMKELEGFRPWESGPMQVVLNKLDDPHAALVVADKIHELLKPGLAGFYGNLNSGGFNIKGTVLTFFTNTNEMEIVESNLPVYRGDWKSATNTNVIAISLMESEKLHAGIGSPVTAVYNDKFGGSATNSYKVAVIFKPGKTIGDDISLVSENNFYYSYLRNLPQESANLSDAFKLASGSVLSNVLGTEWKLLPRTATSDALQKKIRKALKEDFQGSYYDVSSIYEAASFILAIQSGLDIISLIAVMILFFVILIGVLNTLRMTIRERTREIGTIRSIGMQKADVKSAFILETFYLTFLGCVAGIILSIGLLFLVSLIPIETDSMFGMFLVNKHINFVLSPGNPIFIAALLFLLGLEVLLIRYDRYIPVWALTVLLVIFVLAGFAVSGLGGNGILTFLILILNMLIAIAYFPARRAANMEAAAALRQYE